MVAASFERAGGAETGSRSHQLRLLNVVVGLIHLGQAIAMLILSNDFSLPVSRSFLNGPPGTDPSADHAFDLPLGPLVATFLLLAAADHLLTASPALYNTYLRLLGEKRNDIRWIEYSVSASLMIVLIAMITGVSDLGALVAIAGVNATMLFFGLLQERISSPGDGDVNWMPFIFGCFAGAVPWVIIALQVVTAESLGSHGGVPGFVYGILISLFLFFNSFAVNMVLQYKQVGPWRSYLFGEKAYLTLSLVAKSALAWQVFANVLID